MWMHFVSTIGGNGQVHTDSFSLVAICGGWNHIAARTGGPLALYAIPAIGCFVGLSRYAQPFKDEALKKYEPEKWESQQKNSYNRLPIPALPLIRMADFQAFLSGSLSLESPEVRSALSFASRF